MAFKRKKSNPLRILPTNVPQTYWVACRTPETEMDEFVHISHRGLNLGITWLKWCLDRKSAYFR